MWPVTHERPVPYSMIQVDLITSGTHPSPYLAPNQAFTQLHSQG